MATTSLQADLTRANVSRRTLLGAVAAAPVAALPVVAAAEANAAPYAAVINRYVKARDALNACQGTSASDGEIERRQQALSDALDAVDTGAPANWRQFIFKLETAWEDDSDPFQPLKASILADARRLAGAG